LGAESLDDVFYIESRDRDRRRLAGMARRRYAPMPASRWRSRVLLRRTFLVSFRASLPHERGKGARTAR